MKRFDLSEIRDMYWSEMTGDEQYAFAFVMAGRCDTAETAEAVHTPVWFGSVKATEEFEGMFNNAKELMTRLDNDTIKQLNKEYEWIIAA